MDLAAAGRGAGKTGVPPLKSKVGADTEMVALGGVVPMVTLAEGKILARGVEVGIVTGGTVGMTTLGGPPAVGLVQLGQHPIRATARRAQITTLVGFIEP